MLLYEIIRKVGVWLFLLFASSKGYIIRIVKTISMSVIPYPESRWLLCVWSPFCTLMFQARATVHNQSTGYGQQPTAICMCSFTPWKAGTIVWPSSPLFSIQLICRQLSAVKGSNAPLECSTQWGAGYSFQVRWVSNWGMHNCHNMQVRHPPLQNFGL